MKSYLASLFITELAPRFLDSESPFTAEDFLKKLVPNPWDFLVQLLAFLVLLAVVIFVGYKPVKKLLAARKEYVEKNIAGSLEAKKEAEMAALDAQETIEDAKKEASRIVAEAKIEANKQADSIRAQAESDAAKKRIDADAEIELAKAKAMQDAKNQIIDVAIAASSQVLGREVDAKDNERLLSQFIDELNEGGK